MSICVVIFVTQKTVEGFATVNPKPLTLNPKPQTPNPKPSTLKQAVGYFNFTVVTSSSSSLFLSLELSDTKVYEP